jgi:magnesium transporter
LMAYPPESAAGLMTREVVTLSPDLTAEQALVAIRRVAQEAETIYYVYVTDQAGKLLGVLALRDLVLAAPNTPISQLTRRDLVKVRADADREVAARLLTDRGLLAIPVVDENDRLLGIITSDDVADVLEEEATEDITRLGGSEPLDEPYLHSSVATLVRKRVVWLLLLFVGGALTSNVLHHFATTLDQVVALTFFIPLLIGTGGNVGSQIVTTLVRAIGVGEVRLQDLPRVLRKELIVAMLIGVIMAAAALVRAWTLGVEWHLGMVVAVTACFIVLWAATVSAVIPLVLRKMGVDPAVVSAPFLSTLVDATGLFLYLTIARVMLGI